jgi:hypothetical protein
MVPLTTVGSSFEAGVMTARLGADGILTEIRGGWGGPYPLPGPVEVFVAAEQADEARQLLLCDQVESVFDELESGSSDGA